MERENSPSTYSPCEEKVSTDSLNAQMIKIYITSNELQKKGEVKSFYENFKTSAERIVWKTMKVRQTFCGLIVTLSNEEDLDRLLKSDLAKIQGMPVQIVRFPAENTCYRTFIYVKDVPWCISTNEIVGALKMQGIRPGRVTKIQQIVKIEIFSSCDAERLLLEGLSFYNCTSYPTVLSIPSKLEINEQNITQCYR